MTVVDVTQGVPASEPEPTPPPPEAPPEPVSEVDALAGKPGYVTLSMGVTLEVNELSTMGFFKLMRIFTQGASHLFPLIQLRGDDAEEFAGTLIMIALMAVPEAPEETLDFLRFMLVVPEVPGGLGKDGVALTPEGRAQQAQNEAIRAFLVDPPPGDTVAILEAIIRKESPNLAKLGKQLQGMFALQAKAMNNPSPT